MIDAGEREIFLFIVLLIATCFATDSPIQIEWGYLPT